MMPFTKRLLLTCAPVFLVVLTFSACSGSDGPAAPPPPAQTIATSSGATSGVFPATGPAETIMSTDLAPTKLSVQTVVTTPTPVKTYMHSNPTQPEPEDLDGPEVVAQLTALASGVPDSTVLNGAVRNYRITTRVEVRAFTDRFRTADGSPIFTEHDLDKADRALAAGLVLAAGIVHQGCFAVGGAVLVLVDDRIELAATEENGQEGMVECEATVTSVAIVAALPQNLPADAMSPIRDMPADLVTVPASVGDPPTS